MTAPQRASGKVSNPWVTAALVVALLALLVIPFFVVAPGTEFGGADAAAVEELEGRGITAWFDPLFSPDSSEVESGLFALQAGLGGAVLGYVLGRLHGQRGRNRG